MEKIHVENGKTKLNDDFFNQLQDNIENEFEIVKENIEDTLLKVYPIGSVYVSVNSTNPSELFGGTWERFANGRVLVGVDEDDNDFNEVEKESGEKKHTLTINEMPNHNHPNFVDNGQGNGSWGYMFEYNNNSAGQNAGASGYTGGGQAHNNLQPYITCYMWKRTA